MIRIFRSVGLIAFVATVPFAITAAQPSSPEAASAGAVPPQQGGPGRGGTPAGPRLPSPAAFPLPGTYSNTTGISLIANAPGVEIHYTMDGSMPTPASPVFDQRQVLFLAGLYDGDRGLRTGYTLRAIAAQEGFAPSEPATFSYFIERRDRTQYISEMVAPRVRMIRDSDNDKMFLIEGTKGFAST